MKIEKSKKKYNAILIQELEGLIGAKLPSDYVDFLRLYNGGTPETNTFNIKDAKNDSGVNEFMDIQEVISVKKKMQDRFLEKVIPIAFAEGGNYVCLSFEQDKEGVYFWDHELETDEGDPPTWDNMFFLSDSFEGFLQMLQKFDPSKIELKPEQVLEVWVDPEFLKEINKNKKNEE